MEGMNKTLFKSQNENKSKFYQLLHIDKSVYKNISQVLSNNDINVSSVSFNSELYLVEAPNKLARLLRNS